MRLRSTLIVAFLMAGHAWAADDLTGLKARLMVNAGRLAENVTVSERPSELGFASHLRYSFDEDVISNNFNPRERQLLIVPIGPTQHALKGDEKKLFNMKLRLLKEVIYRGIGEYVREIPVFPTINQEQLFHARAATLPLDGGAGVRFITRFGKEGTPNTNDNLFYTFQGLTSDGKILVAFFYPISVRNLPISEDAAISSMYMDQQDPDRFTPNLDLLDQFVQSIQIKK